MSMLSLQNLSRHFPGSDTPAVRDVSLEVPHGEILALVGESGSGKTTLLRLVAGLETPDAGEVIIDGKSVADAAGAVWTPPEKRRVGLVFQDGALFPHLTVAQNCGYGLSRKEYSRDQREQIVGEMLAMTGLGSYRNRFPHQLSGGERQRLAVARALAPSPKLILLDEPFSNLDPALRRSIREDILAILRKADTTAVMVTHDTDDALAIGDRVAIFRSGRVEQTGSPAEIYHHPANGYCARLFGPANEVRLNGSEPTWVRPENMQLLEAAAAGAVPVRVQRVRNAGRHVEAIVEPLGSDASEQKESWTVFADSSALSIPEGKEAWVSWGAIPG